MGRKGRIGPVIAVDGETEYKKSIKSINDNLGVLGSELKKVDAEFSKNEKSMDAARGKLDVYRRQMEQLTQKEKLQAQALQNAQQRYTEAGNKVRELRDKLSAAEKAMDEMKNSSNATSAEIKEQSGVISSLKSDLKNAEKQYSSAEKATKDWQKALNNTKADIATTRQKMEDLAISTIKARDSLESAEKKLEKWQKNLNTMGNTLTAGLTVPIVGAATTMIAAMDDVDEGLDTVMTKTGATGQAAKDLQAVYNEVSQEIPADFGDIGAAVGEINTRLGFTGNVLKNSSEQFLKFAKINNTDVNTSVQLVTRAMGDAGIAAENYGQVLDQLTVASQVSGISVDKLAENLAKYGAPLRALGIDTEYAIAMFAGWEKAGVNTEIAFSGMKKAISTWSDAGKDAKVEFQAVMDEIKKAPDIASATTLAIEAFGTKAGPDLADAIRGGRFEVDTYIQSLENAGGAVNNTYGAIVDEVDDAQLAMQKIKVAMHDTGEAIAKNLGPAFLDLADRLKVSLEWFGKLDKETQQTILKLATAAATIGPVTKGLSGMTGAAKSAVGGVKKLVAELGKQTAIKKAAGGFKDVASAATSVAGSTKGAGSTVGGFASLLTKIASPTGAAVVAAGAIAAIGAAAWKAHEDMVDANLEEHFGDIKLSAEEVEDVAKRLTTTDWTIKLNTSIQETKKLEEYQSKIQSTVDEMNKLQWKVSVGLELSEEEQGAYKQAVDDYVRNVQEYVLQRQYVAQLNLSMVFEDDASGLGEKVTNASDQLYSNTYATLLDLGEQMGEVINEGAKNNTFNAKAIADIKKKMDTELQKLEDQRYEAQINYLGVSLTSNGLDKDSFNEVVTKAQEQINQQMEDIGTFETQCALDIQILKDNGEINEEEYQKALNDIKFDLANRKAEIIQPTFKMELGTIVNNYKEELNAIQPQLDSAFGEALAYSIERGAIAGTESGKIALSNSAASVVETLSQQLVYSYESAAAGMSSTSQSAIKKLLKEMEPTTQQLEEQAQVYRDAGKQVPQSISEGLSDYYELQALMGDVDAINYMLGQKLSTDPQFLNLLATSEDAGKNIDQSVAKGMMDNVSFLKDAATGTVYAVNAQTGQAIAEVTPEFVENMKQMGYTGITSADDLVSNSTLTPPGIDTPNWTAAAYGGLATMDTTVVNNPLGAAGMENPDWSGQAAAGQDSMQSYLDRHPLIAKIKAVWDEAVATVKGWFGIEVEGHADGGFTDREQLSWLSEGNKPEVVIPLAQEKRQRALELYRQTGRELGVVSESVYTVPQTAPHPQRDSIDYTKLAKALAEEMRKTPVEVSVPISVQEGGVYLDNELVGRQQAPVISRIQAKKF